MKCDIDITQIILHELTTNQALSMMKPGFYLSYVLSHDISYMIQSVLKRICNITVH